MSRSDGEDLPRTVARTGASTVARDGQPAPAQSGQARPVFARHAASLVVVRHGPRGPEVLMGVRGAGHRFLPNRLVFPGGAVDPADRHAPAGRPPSGALMAALQRNARPPLARAIAVAAARELEEETGASLGSPPDLDRMAYLCRAVTPTRLPMRFNARFLTVPADALQGTPHDGAELQQVRFHPLDATAALDLMDVTRWVLAVLARHLAAPDRTANSPETLVFGPKRPRHDRPPHDGPRSHGRPVAPG